jgi:hypothetical protein
MQTITTEKLKQMGAPFRNAEIQVSIKANVARLILLVPGRSENHPGMDFPVDGATDYEIVGHELIAAAAQNGLLDAHSTVAIVDADSGATPS